MIHASHLPQSPGEYPWQFHILGQGCGAGTPAGNGRMTRAGMTRSWHRDHEGERQEQMGISGNGRLAGVAGASSGIGRALAGQFGAAGFDLVVAAEDDRIITTAAELQGHGARALTVQADLATFKGVQELPAALPPMIARGQGQGGRLLGQEHGDGGGRPGARGAVQGQDAG
jgi:hypothetical protein